MKTDPFAPDPKSCPECGNNTVIAEHEACVEPYGTCPNTVKLVFVMPIYRCLRCQLVFMDPEIQRKTKAETIVLYQRVLCPSPDLRRWVAENEHLTQLASMTKNGLEQIIKRWEAHRRQWLEAGAGIEPARSGI